MTYVDGYILAVPTAKREAYIELASMAAAVFKDHGAISVTECWGDDVPAGVVTSFPMAVKAEDDETVVFSWVTWPSKPARDAGIAAVFKDPRMAACNPADMPFDGKRMILGGFEAIVEA